MRKENQEKLDKIFYHFKENIYNSEEYNEYLSEETNLMVAFGDWIDNYVELSKAVYNVFGVDDKRLVDKIQAIFDQSVLAYLEVATKPYWELEK